MADNSTNDNYSYAGADGGSGGNTTRDKIIQKRKLIDNAKRFREQGEWDKRWSKFLDVYGNRYEYTELGDWEDTAVPNMIFSTVNVIVPSIAVNNPNIVVEANQAEDAEVAPLVQAVVNNQWRALNVQRQVRQATKDSVIVGHGWAKVTWEYKVATVKFEPEEFMQMAQEALMQKAQSVAMAPDTEGDWPSDEEIIEGLPTDHEVVTVDDPKVTRVSIFDVFVDPDATRIDDARWIAHRIFEPIDQAKKNPDYSAKARSQLSTVYMSKARDNDETAEESKDDQSDQGFAEIWEFYDLDDGTVCTIALGADEYLIKPESTQEMYRRGHPFHFLANYAVPERLFPIGDVETIFPLQLELAFIRTSQLNDMKRGRRITLVRESALGGSGMDDLRDGRDNVIIPVLKDVPFQDVFQQVSSQGLQPEWYAADQKAMADINSVSGIAEFQRGGVSEVRRTATEVGLMQDQTNARLSDKLAGVEDFMSEIAQDMIWLSQKFMDTEHVVRIVDDELGTVWEAYTRETLKGDFTFTVEAGSTQPINESFRQQQAARLMDTFGALLGSGFLNDQEFLKEVFSLNGFKDGDRLLGPGPQPMPPEGGGPEQGGPVPDQGGASQPVPGNIPVEGNF